MSSASGTLAGRFGYAAVGGALLARDAWRPFPTVADRPGWDRVVPALRDRVLDQADACLGPWPPLPATGYAEFTRSGDRQGYEEPYLMRRTRLAVLVLAECLTGQGRYLDAVVDGVWAICEETGWVLPAANYRPGWTDERRWDGPLPDPDRPIVDLFGAETGALLAWTHYLLAPALAPEFARVPVRIEAEVRRRLLRPYRHVDEWNWLHAEPDGRPPNNWNPWIHSNLMAATLLLEDDPGTRAALVARVLRGLDRFLAGYGPDGGCDEGASYFWVAAGRVFDCLDLLRDATGGRLDAFDDPTVREMGRFFHRMHIGADWYVNVGDSAARIRGGDGELLHRFGVAVDDPEMRAHALAMRATGPADVVNAFGSLRPALAALFDTAYAEAPETDPPLVRDTWLPDIEVLACRERAGTTAGLFLAAKGGHNGVSHSHNDAGGFVVALDGVPLVVDVGVGVYTRQTFGPDRYRIWTMRSGYHNVPVVDGHEQEAGAAFRARDVTCDLTGDASALRLDLAAAYPAAAGIHRWTRALRLDRARGRVELTDDYRLAGGPARLALHLMTWPEPRLDGPGRVVLPTGGRDLVVEHDPAAFTVRAERIPIDDERLGPTWGPAVHRLVLEAVRPAAEGAWHLTFRPTPTSPLEDSVRSPS